MTPSLSFAQRARLASEVRARVVTESMQAMVALAAAVEERFTALLNEAGSSREMQMRRDAWTLFQRKRTEWPAGAEKAWRAALNPPTVVAKKVPIDGIGGLELIETEVLENRIVVSRWVQGLSEKAGTELKELGLRVRHLEGTQELEAYDILRPEVLLLVVIEQWAKLGLSREAWAMVADLAQKLLLERLKLAYGICNEILIKQGVLPTIELETRVKRAPTPSAQRHAEGDKAPDQAPNSSSPSLPSSSPGAPAGGRREAAGAHDEMPGGPAPQNSASQSLLSQHGEPSASAIGAFGGRLGWGSGEGASAPSRPTTGGGLMPRASNPTPMSGSPSMGRSSSGYGATADETRMMTATTPLARARSRALGVMGQLKRLLVGAGGVDGDAAVAPPAPSPALAAALAVRPHASVAMDGGDTVMEDFSPAGVARVVGELRRRTSDLKSKAQTSNEKAIIEIVALMFQAILQEERIPPGVRVWFARLQMPVLRVALAEPDFFSSLNHPARQLIDRMGSCVMGFDDHSVNSQVLQVEIKRIVQVIEQYPETGKRVYQLVYEEFQKFLAQFLRETDAAKKVVSVAQQVEQKETLTIQYTIEMRNMLKDMPVREEIREFLFKVWAEVLAVAAVRNGPRHAQTLELKKLATDLVWAASAKPNRSDRARVIQDLPQLLQKLRAGMTMLGLVPAVQEAHIKTVSDTLADAFMSKTQAIAAEQIKAMAERLESLEDFVSDDGMGDLPLDAESIELMLGVDAATIVVIANGGSMPNAAMLAWAQELQLGAWFMLDHNDHVVPVQLMWRSDRKHLHLMASADGRSYLIQAGRLAAYLQAGLLVPQEEETLTVRATRDALVKLEANPERLLN